MRTLACRAYWRALEGRPGVVHLNFPLREPLVSERDGAAAPRRHRAPRWPSARDLHARAPGGARGRALPRRAGDRRPPGGWSWPGATSATPRSVRPPRHSARRPAGRCWPTRSRARGAGRRRWRTTTRCCATARSPPVSSPTSCCASATCPRPSRCAGGSQACATFRRWRLEPEGRWQDPDAALCRSLRAGARRGVAGAGGGARPAPDPDWLASWRSADERAAEATARGARRKRPQRAHGRRRARRAAARAGDAVRSLLDAGARHRELLAGARRPPAGAVQPRRQRHRRHRLERLRRCGAPAPGRWCC